MSPSPPTIQDILELTHGMQQDIRQLNAKLTTIRSWLAAQPNTQRTHQHVCPEPHCKLGFLTKARLDDHTTNVHGKALATSDPPR
jgi:hypothetical protein